MAKETQELGFVIDKNAIKAPRTHAVILEADAQGRPISLQHYELNARTPTQMPMDHAMTFLRDPAFVVTDAEGIVLRPATNTEKMTHIQIPEGMVLVAYEELSRSALATRCKLLPGSQAIHPLKTSCEDMAAFLKKADANKQKSTGTAGVTPELSAEALAFMDREAA